MFRNKKDREYLSLMELYRNNGINFRSRQQLLITLKKINLISNKDFNENKNRKFYSVSNLYKEMNILKNDFSFFKSLVSSEPLLFNPDGTIIETDNLDAVFNFLYSIYKNERMIYIIKTKTNLFAKRENENIIKTYFKNKKNKKEALLAVKAEYFFSILYISFIIYGYSFSLQRVDHKSMKSTRKEMNFFIEKYEEESNLSQGLSIGMASTNLFNNEIINFIKKSAMYDLEKGFKRAQSSLSIKTKKAISKIVFC